MLVGLLLFGSTGFLVGLRSGGSEGDTAPAAGRYGASDAAPLLVFESNQLALNRPKFDGDLLRLAESWLPWVGGCANDVNLRGPQATGERFRIFCRLNNLDVYFIQYTSVPERDKARAVREQQNGDATTLAPGAAAPVQRPTTSGRTTGSYIEFAFGAGASTVAGIWWENTATPVAAYFETLWTEGVGERWEPMREVWRRYS